MGGKQEATLSRLFDRVALVIKISSTIHHTRVEQNWLSYLLIDALKWVAGNSDAQQARGTTHSIKRGDSPFQNTTKYGIFKTPQKKNNNQKEKTKKERKKMK